MPRISAVAIAAALFFALASSTPDPAVASEVPGDDYPGITIDSLPFTDSVDTSGASNEPGEPIGSCLFGGGPPLATVWYNFTPSEDMLLRADTLGSDYDTVTVVWTISAFPGAPLGEVVCSDDFGFSGDSGGAFEAEAGRTYYIQAGGYPFAEGTGNLVVHLQEVTPPAHDDVDDAQPIGAVPYIHLTDTGAASIEDGEPMPSCTFGAPVESTVWYTFDPPHTGAYVADTLNSNFDSAVAVYAGSPGALTEVWCNDQGGFFRSQARVGFEADFGTTLYIQVGGFPGFGPANGVMELTVDVLDIPDCEISGNSVADPAGDSVGVLRKDHDIVSVRDGVGDESVCFRVEFADDFSGSAEAAAQPFAAIAIDADSDASTGVESITDFNCDAPSGIGEEAEVVVLGGNLIAPMLTGFVPQSPSSFPFPFPFDEYGFVSFGDSSLTVTLPFDTIGGDGVINIAMVVGNELEVTDCAPDEGHISLPIGARKQGDIDCDGDADAVDAQRLLSYVAGLPVNLPPGCAAPGSPAPASAAAVIGDIDCDSDVDSVDVLNILRNVAGLPVQQQQPCALIGQPLFAN